MIYFDNAATGGRKPDSVLRAVRASMEGYCANPGRSGHRLSVAAANQILRCRALLAQFFHAPDCERVILTKNCSEALNLAIFGMVGAVAQPNQPTPHVISTVAEHNSVLRPLFFLERTGKITLTLIPLRRGKIDAKQIGDAVQDNTVAAVFTLASNVTGTSVDPAAVRENLPDRILTVCDGAQACGHIPIDMQAAGIDALCLAGHKGMHAMQGSGALLFSERFNPVPLLYGGTGSESFNPDMPDFYPDRLEAGTLSCPAAASLSEGVLHLMTSLSKTSAYLKKLTAVLLCGLSEIDSVRIYSKPNPFGIVAFACRTLQSEFFAQRLSDEYDICVRGGLHCAPKMHEALKTRDGLVRVSLSEFNTLSEVNAFIDAAKAIARSV